MVIKKGKLGKEDDEEEKLTVTTVEESTDIDSSNQDLVERRYVFPMLAEGVTKLRRKYPDDQRKALESEFSDFKSKTDFSIPVKRTVTKIVRIRTMSNEDQALGEYLYYTANLEGYQKHYIDNKLQSYPSAVTTDVPFGMDIKKNLQPSYKNGELTGYDERGEFPFYTEKFTPEGIDTILGNNSPPEGRGIDYVLLDSGSSYGGFTKDEIQQCKLNRLVYRNTSKLNGTEITDEDKIK